MRKEIDKNYIKIGDFSTQVYPFLKELRDDIKRAKYITLNFYGFDYEYFAEVKKLFIEFKNNSSIQYVSNFDDIQNYSSDDMELNFILKESVEDPSKKVPFMIDTVESGNVKVEIDIVF